MARRKNQFRSPVLVLLILAALAASPASAAAVVTSSPNGRLSYLPVNEHARGALSGALNFTTPSGSPPLLWHGGPVMQSPEAFAIFWSPAGYSFPSGYKEAIVKYLENVAADSGLPTNVYSVSAQYVGSNGHATYDDTFGGFAIDTHAYPTTGTCPPYTAGFNSVEYTACLSDAKIEAEVQVVRAEKGWPSGLGAEYYMVLPPQVGSCFGTTAKSGCFDEEFCAYHSYTESAPTTIYANISFAPGDPIGCGVGEYPNGHANGNVDDTLSSLSHEANESITDPLLNAYFDKKGFENGDECRNTKFGEDYGPPLGGSEVEETLFNQEIGANDYYLQQEWSNDIEDCAQRVGPPGLVVSGPASATVGQVVDFNAFGSTPGDGGIGFYEWDFGDGSGEEGEEAEEVAHTYSAPGTFTVTLTVYDDGGFAYSKSRQISIKAPEEPPSGGGGGGGSGGGSGGASSSSSSSSSSSNSTGQGSGPPKPGLAVAAAKAKVKNGLATVKLTCGGGGPCSGVIRLIDHGVIGHASFHLAAGETKVLKVRLTSVGLALLAKKSGGLRVGLSGTGVRHRTLTLTAG